MSAPAAVGWRVAPGGTVAGTFTVPGDKSISHRALMLGAIAHGETRIRGFLDGEDCLATAGALAALGVRIERPVPTEVHVHGAGAGALRAAAGWRVAPGGTVAGTLTVPGDKSISHRALMLAAIAQGETHIRGFLDG